MEQQISDKIYLNKSYKIDKQFLVCLDDIFAKYDSNVKVKVVASCNNTTYRFSTINELLEESPKLSEKIEKLCITAHFPIAKGYSYNEICATFSNSTELSPSTDTITFDFSDPNAYLVLKNQIETLLKNYKLGYSVLARTPLLAVLSTTTFWYIYGYTNLRNIVFSKDVQTLICLSWFLCLALSIYSPVRKLKRFLYPRNELHVGVNINAYDRAKGWRSIIHVGVVLSFVVGLAVNIASNFLL